MCRAKSTYDDNLILPYHRRPPWCCTVIPSRPDLLKDSLGIYGWEQKQPDFTFPEEFPLHYYHPNGSPVLSSLQDPSGSQARTGSCSTFFCSSRPLSVLLKRVRNTRSRIQHEQRKTRTEGRWIDFGVLCLHINVYITFPCAAVWSCKTVLTSD